MGATLKSRLPAISAELRPRVGAAVKAGAEAIAETASRNAPRESDYTHQRLHPDLPHLPESIEARRRAPAEYGVYANWYYLFTEFGTINDSAQPYLMPAAELEKDPLVAGVQAVLKTL